ncbi:MAG: hypothetical protein VX988_10720, partial [Planctomycetota bacterium]|nr:hypothetical protein [Planctomycetota bacterium]
MTHSDTATDATELRQALAELRSRLDQQQTIILDGFTLLRQEFDRLDAQIRQLETQTSRAEITHESSDKIEAVFAAEEENTATSASGTGASGISPPTGDAQANIPVGKAVRLAEDEPPSASDFNFGEHVPTREEPAEPHDFNPAASDQPETSQSQTIDSAATEFTAKPLPQGEELNMEQVIFGLDLAANQTLSPERQTLLQGLYAGNADAMTLLGQILIFRGAGADRMPGLLKEVGEAYYRWRSDTTTGQDPFRDELIGWLQRNCDQSGVPNTIELVQPSDRYDSKRHHSKDRGIEVDRVHGWVVLRDNGKVYTKA